MEELFSSWLFSYFNQSLIKLVVIKDPSPSDCCLVMKGVRTYICNMFAFIFCKRWIRQSPTENTTFYKASFYEPNSLNVLDREPVNVNWGCGFHCLAGRLNVRFSTIVSIVILKSLYGSRLPKPMIKLVGGKIDAESTRNRE